SKFDSVKIMASIAEILENKGEMVLTVDINESVLDAINLMAQVNIGAVLVQEDDRIAGVFTERDYLQKIALKSLSSKDTRVGDVMTTPVVSADPADSVQQCMETMTTCRCRHLPVVQDGKLLGIVSIGDLVKKMLDEKEAEVEQLNQYITGTY
ncbi:MAG: CBS domain-containing protein, partial [Lysobacterales bacterium]